MSIERSRVMAPEERPHLLNYAVAPHRTLAKVLFDKSIGVWQDILCKKGLVAYERDEGN